MCMNTCVFRERFGAKPQDRCWRVTGKHTLLAWKRLLQLCLQGLDPVGETFRRCGSYKHTHANQLGLTLKKFPPFRFDGNRWSSEKQIWRLTVVLSPVLCPLPFSHVSLGCLRRRRRSVQTSSIGTPLPGCLGMTSPQWFMAGQRGMWPGTSSSAGTSLRFCNAPPLCPLTNTRTGT